MARKNKEETEIQEEKKAEEKAEAIENAKQEEKNEEWPELGFEIDVLSEQASGGKNEGIENEDEKIELKTEKKKGMEKTLVPLEDYVKCGIHLGTKVITPHMRNFVYRRRADSLAVLNTNVIDEKLKKAIEFISKYPAEEIMVVCKREAGWQAVKTFSEVTGIRAFTKKYPAGIITNTNLPNFFEVDLVMISDPWLDKNALSDAKKVNKKVLGLCDTNNLTFNVDIVIPCNNKSNKSLGLVYYILAREYLKARGIKKELPKLDDFIGEEIIEKKEEKLEDDVERQIKAKLRMIEAREGV